MKKYIPLTLLSLFIILLIYFMGLNSSTKINWPDFIRLDNKFYLNTNIKLNSSNIIDKVGAIESNSPKKSCKWSPMNNESGKLPIGTEIYYINDTKLTGIAAYVAGDYIYYEEISEDVFYTLYSEEN